MLDFNEGSQVTLLTPNPYLQAPHIYNNYIIRPISGGDLAVLSSRQIDRIKVFVLAALTGSLKWE